MIVKSTIVLNEEDVKKIIKAHLFKDGFIIGASGIKINTKVSYTNHSGDEYDAIFENITVELADKEE